MWTACTHRVNAVLWSHTDKHETYGADTMTDTKSTYESREAWLYRAVEIFRPRFEEIGATLPKLRISVGFGPTGARKESTKILGVTLHNSVVADGAFEIWISPEDADTASMLGTVIHELVHTVSFEDGHKGKFAEYATRLGLEGPMTATHASLELAVELITIAETLGDYPGSHVDLNGAFVPTPVGPDGQPVPVSSGGPKQTTRMLKVTCEDTECPCYGFTVRLAKKWLEMGAPKCPMGHEMLPS